MKRLDLEGQRFGKLLVLGYTAEEKYAYSKCAYKWVCECKCGQITVCMTSNLTKKGGHSTSCGNCIGFQLNHNFLDNIGPKQAYFLGFMYSDGNRSKKTNQLSISLSEVDKHILIQFQEWLGHTGKLSYLPKRKIHDTEYIGNAQFKLHICSNKLSIRCEDYGIVPNKTYVKTDFNFLDSFDDDIFNFWLLGLLDGDAYVSETRRYGIVITLRGHATTTIPLCQYLKNRFNDTWFNISFDPKNKQHSTIKFMKPAAQYFVPRLWGQNYVGGLHRKRAKAELYLQRLYQW